MIWGRACFRQELVSAGVAFAGVAFAGLSLRLNHITPGLVFAGQLLRRSLPLSDCFSLGRPSATCDVDIRDGTWGPYAEMGPGTGVWVCGCECAGCWVLGAGCPPADPTNIYIYIYIYI